MREKQKETSRIKTGDCRAQSLTAVCHALCLCSPSGNLGQLARVYVVDPAVNVGALDQVLAAKVGDVIFDILVDLWELQPFEVLESLGLRRGVVDP